VERGERVIIADDRDVGDGNVVDDGGEAELDALVRAEIEKFRDSGH